MRVPSWRDRSTSGFGQRSREPRPPLVAEPLLERGGVGGADDVADDTAVVGFDDEREIGMPRHVRQDEDLRPEAVVVEHACGVARRHRRS